MNVDLALDALADELADMIVERLADRDETRISAGKAESVLGLPRGYLSPTRHPERVPYFGARGVLWPAHRWRRWNEVPEGARLRQWDAMPLARRSAILGAL